MKTHHSSLMQPSNLNPVCTLLQHMMLRRIIVPLILFIYKAQINNVNKLRGFIFRKKERATVNKNKDFSYPHFFCYSYRHSLPHNSSLNLVTQKINQKVNEPIKNSIALYNYNIKNWLVQPIISILLDIPIHWTCILNTHTTQSIF